MPHVTIFPSGEFKGRSKNGVYGDVIEELDWSIGKVVEAISKAGISEKTLIVFTSDNGPWKMFNELGGSSAHLRGEKSTTGEGGECVPCIFHWPGEIKPSVICSPPLLYDIKTDPSESKDIADLFPELVDRLTREYQATKEAIANCEKIAW